MQAAACSVRPTSSPCWSTIEGGAADADVIEAYLARALAGLRNGLTGRIAASLALGIPLVGAAGGICGRFGGGDAVAGIVAVLLTVAGLNVYYTEVERDLEKERLRGRRRE